MGSSDGVDDDGCHVAVGAADGVAVDGTGVGSFVGRRVGRGVGMPVGLAVVGVALGVGVGGVVGADVMLETIAALRARSQQGVLGLSDENGWLRAAAGAYLVILFLIGWKTSLFLLAMQHGRVRFSNQLKSRSRGTLRWRLSHSSSSSGIANHRAQPLLGAMALSTLNTDAIRQTTARTRAGDFLIFVGSKGGTHILGYPASVNRNYQVQPEWPLIEALLILDSGPGFCVNEPQKTRLHSGWRPRPPGRPPWRHALRRRPRRGASGLRQATEPSHRRAVPAAGPGRGRARSRCSLAPAGGVEAGVAVLEAFGPKRCRGTRG